MADTAAEIEIAQQNITTLNNRISWLMAERKKAENYLFDLKTRPGKGMVVLAAKHLDPAEGLMGAGHCVTSTDLAALRKVLDFVSRHLECEEGNG